MSETEVIFLRVKDNGAKRTAICQTIVQQFEEGRRVLVAAPNEKVAKYIDQLLWSYPPESFIPHLMAGSACNVPVVIARGTQNLNKAKVVLNLCPQPSPLSNEVETVYELLDETDPGKKAVALQKQQAYQAQGFQVSVGAIH